MPAPTAAATPQSKPSADPSKSKLDALKGALGQIEKQFGKGTIMRLGDDARVTISGIPTGSLALDLALGGAGVPRGRVVEIFGPEGSGKTTLALTVVANAQKGGGTAAYIDAEHAIDPTYAAKLGVNVKDLLLSQPDSGEQALEICEILVRSNSVDVIVVDSVAALVPRAEIEGEMGDAHVGLQARLMSQALRKLCAIIARSKTCVIFINQIREKIGVMFGSPETTPGGRALKFYSTVRIDIRRIQTLKEGELAVGNRVRAHVVKNKIAPPFKKVEFDLLFASGISREGDILDLGESTGVLSRQGTWLSHKNKKLGQGREKARELLRAEPETAAKIEAEIKAKAGLGPVAAATPPATAKGAKEQEE
jgi:recombination protein RecA